MALPRIVVIGGGFGGLNVAIGLRRAKADVVLIDKKNHHLFQPLLYQVATAALSPADIAIPLREILRNQRNATVMMGEVTHIDKEKKCLILGNGDHVDYDYLVIAIGARHSYFGNDQWESLAPGLKTITDALNIREGVLKSFEKAERTDSISEAEKYLNFVIIGGGPTGVEMAGSIAEIAHKTMFKNFRRIQPDKSKIYLVEAAPRILPPFPEDLSQRAKEDLEKLGVRVLVNQMVTNITDEGVQVGDKFIESKNVIWAAGNQVSKMLSCLEAPTDRGGRVIVEPDLTIPDHPEIFVIGDCAHSAGKDGKPLPGIAPTAIQQGNYVAKILGRKDPMKKRKRFKYWDKGMLATIGKAKAVGLSGKMKLTGLFAWIVWGFLHIFYLIGFRNRYSVVLSWTIHYLTGMRGARLIHGNIDEDLPKKTGKPHP